MPGVFSDLESDMRAWVNAKLPANRLDRCTGDDRERFELKALKLKPTCNPTNAVGELLRKIRGAAEPEYTNITKRKSPPGGFSKTGQVGKRLEIASGSAEGLELKKRRDDGNAKNNPKNDAKNNAETNHEQTAPASRHHVPDNSKPIAPARPYSSTTTGPSRATQPTQKPNKLPAMTTSPPVPARSAASRSTSATSNCHTDDTASTRAGTASTPARPSSLRKHQYPHQTHTCSNDSSQSSAKNQPR